MGVDVYIRMRAAVFSVHGPEKSLFALKADVSDLSVDQQGGGVVLIDNAGEQRQEIDGILRAADQVQLGQSVMEVDVIL